MSLRLRGGGYYVTKADFIKAGTEYDEYNMLQDWGMIWQSKKWFPPVGREMGHGQLVPVLGIEHDGTFDNETTTLMQIRLAIERTHYNALRKAMHNACELEAAQWTPRLNQAFEIGVKALSILLRKVDFRLLYEEDEDRGTYRLTPEEKMGPRAPIPPSILRSQRTVADLLIGPRDGTTRLRIDPELTMEENHALWDALESEWLRNTELPEVQNLTFQDPFLEAVYTQKAEGEVLSWPNVDTPWKELKALALERAEAAIRDPEIGEVGSAWYQATPPANDTAELYPDGAWWFMNGEVRRLPGLFWCNGQFTAVEEPFDEKRLRQEGCPHCPFSDCLHPKREIRRYRRIKAFKEKGVPSPDPLRLAELSALPSALREEALFNATRRGEAGEVQALLLAGAQVNSRDARSGNSPLHFAARYGYEDVVLVLCGQGADTAAKSQAGSTPLHFAAHFGKTLACEALVKAGADVNARCDLGYTALHEAAEEKHNFTASKLLQLGADPWLRNHENDTALNIAEGGYCAVLSMLLRKAMGLELCQCHGCAGYSTGFNNMMTEHITDEQTRAYWENELYSSDEFYNTTFAEEMQKGAEEMEAYSEQYAKMPQMGQVDPVEGGWEEVKGGEWWLKMAKEKATHFYEEYHAKYGNETEPPRPAQEAVDIFEMLQKKEEEEEAAEVARGGRKRRRDEDAEESEEEEEEE